MKITDYMIDVPPDDRISPEIVLENLKITKSQLDQIIQEELTAVLEADSRGYDHRITSDYAANTAAQREYDQAKANVRQRPAKGSAAERVATAGNYAGRLISKPGELMGAFKNALSARVNKPPPVTLGGVDTTPEGAEGRVYLHPPSNTEGWEGPDQGIDYESSGMARPEATTPEQASWTKKSDMPGYDPDSPHS